MDTLPPLSRAFARFIAQQSNEAMDAIVPRTAAWLSLVNQQGHVCLDLVKKSKQPWFDAVGSEQYAPPFETWKKALEANHCIADGAGYAPMVLCDGLLYLHRFYSAESRLIKAIRCRLHAPLKLDVIKLWHDLHAIFGTQSTGEQAQAVALAAGSLFAVISGGPGTGKTTSLVKLLAVLLAQQPSMQIRLAAPTGKAAARMMEAIREKINTLNIDASVRQAIPTDAYTIHRLLGFDGRDYRHRTEHRLALDCLVIDEASMVDLPMMARVVDALPTHARLILLGDRDQLASVEAGSVLGDITGNGMTMHQQSEATRHWLASLHRGQPIKRIDKTFPIADAIALLSTSYRFSGDSGIASLATASHAGDANAAAACFDQPYADIVWQHSSTGITEQAATEYAKCYAQTAEETLHRLDSFRVLCAIKKGSVGVEGINQAIAAFLQQRGIVRGMHGMLIMITINHTGLELFNGDVGLIWRDDKNDNIKAYFNQLDGGVRVIPLTSLPAYVPAWAITVHKAQGSEFDRVMLVLPDNADNPLLDRALLYTAITRARQCFMLYATPAVLTSMIERKPHRSSGLAQRLGWSASTP
ncbi:MAG: exodeoxyribonuclease V subunit alpha, partial [Mariprofundaceae bacterium]|nr:exodeoxyribonuclease V subunit alpha [Mariprofundaceae bacterium]